MSTIEPGATAPTVTVEEPRPRFWHRKHWRSFRQRSPEDRAAFMVFARRYDAQIWMLIVAIGLPLMGWLVRDFTLPSTTIVITSYETKITIAALWFAFTHYYWPLELDEIRAQIKEYGLLDVEESDYQRSTMQSLYYGIVGAVVVWVVVLAIHITVFFVPVFFMSQWPGEGWLDGLWAMTEFVLWSWYTTPVFYGLVEVAILYHTFKVGRGSIASIWPLISIIQQALASQMRRETKATNQ